MARPNNREARVADALDAALKIMNRDGIQALVSLLSVEKVVREAGLSDTARRDWEGVRGAGILQSLATERLNDWSGSGAGAIAESLFAGYPDPDDERSLRDRFLDLLMANHELSLELDTTIPVWMVHIAAASASPLRGASMSGDSSARDLAEMRRRFYGEMAALYGMVLETFLADMGWRPIDGWDTTSIVTLLTTLHDGSVLRRLVDPDAFGPDGRNVALAQLALLESLTEPIEPDLADPTDLRAWVHEAAPLVVMGRPDGDIDFDEVVDALATQIKPTTDLEDVKIAFAEAYPEPALLWDSSLRWLLSSLGSTLQLRGIKADSAILRVAVHRLREAALTHSVLVAVALTTRHQVPSSYLDELEGVLGDLLDDMGAADPRLLAAHITRFSLQGQHETVVALLETAALPPPSQGW
jgi:hypothetical protein